MIRLTWVCVATLLSFISTSAFAETCIASHYGYSGGRTASGERMNPNAMTAAHRTKSFRFSCHCHLAEKRTECHRADK